MNLTKNLILALCFTFNPGAPGNNFFIKPSVYLMPKVIFTNYTNWELVKSKNAIKVFSQWVTLCDGYKTHRLRGDFQIKMPLPDIIAILKDVSKVKNRMEGVSESYCIKNQDNLWYSYSKFNIPWPFDDQDLIVENLISRIVKHHNNQGHMENQEMLSLLFDCSIVKSILLKKRFLAFEPLRLMRLDFFINACM